MSVNPALRRFLRTLACMPTLFCAVVETLVEELVGKLGDEAPEGCAMADTGPAERDNSDYTKTHVFSDPGFSLNTQVVWRSNHRCCFSEAVRVRNGACPVNYFGHPPQLGGPNSFPQWWGTAARQRPLLRYYGANVTSGIRVSMFTPAPACVSRTTGRSAPNRRIALINSSLRRGA